MWPTLVEACRQHDLPAQPNITELRGLILALQREMGRVTVSQGEDLPYGRYLVADEEGFNIQVDIFSRGYTGAVHSHGTWGIFGLIQGGLVVEDWQEVKGDYYLERVSALAPGSCQGFAPPVSDWHRVATPKEGPQTVSVHIYGAGFDLDTGIYLNEKRQPVSAARSAFGAEAALRRALSFR